MDLLREEMPVKDGEFRKRIYNFRDFRADLLYLLRSSSSLLNAFRSGRIRTPLIRKIFLVVSSVNSCVYCTWVHSTLAYLGGMEREEIKSLLSGEAGAVTEDIDLAAVAYAREYAESAKSPAPEMTAALYDLYGKEKASDIILCIQAISFANLACNTFDAFISRMRGVKAPESSFLSELVIFIISAPLILPVMPFVKKASKGLDT